MLKKFLKKNSELAAMLHQLEPVLSQRNRLGYVAARNFRILSDALTEYNQFKIELIKKYGEQDMGDTGEELPTVSIKIDSPKFKAFCDEMAAYNNIEQEVELMTAKFDDVVGVLSGAEIIGIDWMLEE